MRRGWPLGCGEPREGGGDGGIVGPEFERGGIGGARGGDVTAFLIQCAEDFPGLAEAGRMGRRRQCETMVEGGDAAIEAAAGGGRRAAEFEQGGVIVGIACQGILAEGENAGVILGGAAEVDECEQAAPRIALPAWPAAWRRCSPASPRLDLRLSVWVGFIAGLRWAK